VRRHKAYSPIRLAPSKAGSSVLTETRTPADLSFSMGFSRMDGYTPSTRFDVGQIPRGIWAMSRTQLQVWVDGHEDYAAFLSC
jgi:hypothetical protein